VSNDTTSQKRPKEREDSRTFEQFDELYFDYHGHYSDDDEGKKTCPPASATQPNQPSSQHVSSARTPRGERNRSASNSKSARELIGDSMHTFQEDETSLSTPADSEKPEAQRLIGYLYTHSSGRDFLMTWQNALWGDVPLRDTYGS
jgi:hypothetical protein